MPANASVTATSKYRLDSATADGITITPKNHKAIAPNKAGRIFSDDGKQESVIKQTEMSAPLAHRFYLIEDNVTPPSP